MRWTAFLIAVLALVVGACGDPEDGSEPLAVDDYVDEINSVVDEFRSDQSAAEDVLGFPVEGELAAATEVFMAYDTSLRAMRSVSPPSEVAAQHEEFVQALDGLQATVLSYLQKAGVEGGFTFEGLNADPEVERRFSEFQAACDALADRLNELGAEGVPTVCSDA